MKIETLTEFALHQLVVCAAIRDKDSGLIVCGARHFDSVMRAAMCALPIKDWHSAEQGFIDQRGNFLNRHEAFKVASANGQIRRQLPGAAEGLLFSEHLY